MRKSRFRILEGGLLSKEFEPSRNSVRNFRADDIPVTWVSKLWERLTKFTVTLEWNPSNPLYLSVGWDHFSCGICSIPCLSSVWILWCQSRGGGGWRSRIGVWVNINTNYVLSTWFLLRLHCYVALFLYYDIELLLIISLTDRRTKTEPEYPTNSSLHFLCVSYQISHK